MSLVIFDCDGVLIDSEAIACGVDAAVLSGLGIPYTADEVMAQFVGKSFADMVAAIEAERGLRLPADFAARVDAALAEAFARELRPIAGIEAVLDGLTARTCVASSSTHKRLALTLGLTDLLRRFPGRVFSAEEVARGKPAPDLFLHAARRCGVAPERAVVVEDSPAGVAGAIAAGMAVIGFTGGSHCGTGHAARLQAAGAAMVVASAAALPEAIAAALSS